MDLVKREIQTYKEKFKELDRRKRDRSKSAEPGTDLIQAHVQKRILLKKIADMSKDVVDDEEIIQ